MSKASYGVRNLLRGFAVRFLAMFLHRWRGHVRRRPTLTRAARCPLICPLPRDASSRYVAARARTRSVPRRLWHTVLRLRASGSVRAGRGRTRVPSVWLCVILASAGNSARLCVATDLYCVRSVSLRVVSSRVRGVRVRYVSWIVGPTTP